jgi:4-amino-4-deoxy-L-arabinose transferase-like glycosyltransferase
MGAATASKGDATAAHFAVVAIVSALLAIPGVFSLPPLDRDESRFAQATVQMIESGDYVTIRFQDRERNKKPAGIHWLQAAGVSAFSTPQAREIWAYRLPSVLGAVLAGVFTFAAAARLYGPSVAMLAAMLLAAAPLFAAESTIAKTDAMLLATITLAQCALISVYADAREKRKSGWATAAAFWIALGCGVLIKGPVAPLVSVATAAALVVQSRNARWLGRLRPLAGAALLILMIAPWAMAIDTATQGRFFADALGGDMFGKLGSAQEGHAGPPGYHLLLLPVLFWPAAALLAPGVAQIAATRRTWTSQVLLAWIAPTWIIFELTATKLPHYTLPLYPAIAILCARVAYAAPQQREIARRAGAALFGAVGLAAAIGIVVLMQELSSNAPGPFVYLFAATIALASGAVAALFWRRRPIAGAWSAIALSALVTSALLQFVLPRLDALALSPRLSAAIETARLHPLKNGAPPVAISGYYEPSAVFLLGSKTQFGDGAAVARYFSEHRSAAIAVEERELQAFQAAARDVAFQEFALVDGLNYSNGRRMRIHVFRAETP